MKINLRKLRAGHYTDEEVLDDILLALIDTTEAAIEKERILNEGEFNDGGFENADYRLRQTLTRYET